MFSLFKLFENKENTFSYENQKKTKFENKKNEFTIFNILYMNQKTVLCCFPCFRIKSKTQDLVDWDKTNVTPHPDEVHSTCNCKGAYVHQVTL